MILVKNMSIIHHTVSGFFRRKRKKKETTKEDMSIIVNTRSMSKAHETAGVKEICM